MTALTPDEVVERFGANWPRLDEPTKWHARHTLMLLEDAGLVVVDATDTPNEPLWTGETTFIGSREDPRPNKSWFLGSMTLDVPPYTPIAIVRTSAEELISAGGSSGERGTVTQETSADDKLTWTKAAPAHTTGDASSITIAGPYLGVPDDRPFPNAYPGPQVDGQPTWGTNYSDIPRPRNAWQWTVNMGDWFSAEVVPMAGEPYWVLVRRTPQPATERVPWHEAVGRYLMVNGGTKTVGVAVRVEKCDDQSAPRCFYVDGDIAAWITADPDDGTVEVLKDEP